MTTTALLPDASDPLDRAAAEAAFGAILDGQVDEAEVARFLTAMAERDESSGEIAAAARALRQRMIEIAAPDTAALRTRINEIRKNYVARFHQDSVGLLTIPGCGTF